MNTGLAPTAGRVRAWLEVARISNAPTVISNIIAGAALVTASGSPRPVALLSLAAVLFYTAGMMLNDVLDADIDRAERPTRPIPSGRVGRAEAALVAILFLAGGLLLCREVSSRAFDAAIVLVGAVLLYNVIHARTVLSVFVMGLCRGMLYLLAAAALLPATDSLASPLVLPALLLILYTASFSLVARREVLATPARSITAVIPAILGGGVILSCPANLPARIVAATVVAALLALPARHVLRRAPTPDLRRAVLGWIAGFAIIDAGVCAATGHYPLAAACLACYALTRLAHRRILGT